MARIVYLMGAGASINCIPAVNGLEEGFIEIAKEIQQLNDQSKKRKEGEKGLEIQADETVKAIQWLAEISNNRASIDTVAKSFFLKNDIESLNRLKIGLDGYLQFQQIFKPVDKRYDLFLASLLKNSNQILPEEIKIISWNYDNQFELAYEKYYQLPNQMDSRNSLKMIDKYRIKDNSTGNDFIFKLNGSAGIIVNKTTGSESYSGRFDQLNYAIINQLLKTSSGHLETAISFAWEDPHLAEWHLPKILYECEVIVTIGYSFPFFNRQIDKMIFKEAKNLKKVYIQNPAAASIEEKLKNLIEPGRNIYFVQDTSTEEFLIPYEL
jgi:hypothetical protein